MSMTSHVKSEYEKVHYIVDTIFYHKPSGWIIKYVESSFDNCEMLEKAIVGYFKVPEVKDIAPVLLGFLNVRPDENLVDSTQEGY